MTNKFKPGDLVRRVKGFKAGMTKGNEGYIVSVHSDGQHYTIKGFGSSKLSWHDGVHLELVTAAGGGTIKPREGFKDFWDKTIHERDAIRRAQAAQDANMKAYQDELIKARGIKERRVTVKQDTFTVTEKEILESEVRELEKRVDELNAKRAENRKRASHLLEQLGDLADDIDLRHEVERRLREGITPAATALLKSI
jgi:DUF971 family protein